MAAVFDPRLVLQGGLAQGQAQSRMFDMLSGAVDQYSARKAQEQAQLADMREKAIKYSRMEANPVTGEYFNPYAMALGGQMPQMSQQGSQALVSPVYGALQPTPQESTQDLQAVDAMAFENLKQRQVALEERAKLDAREEFDIRKSEREEKLSDKETVKTIGLVDRMIDFNEKTLDMPYAGLAQPITRVSNQKAAENMAQLQQMRLRIAAPLAKQLGVNPTDKDFQNTLDQIFNENESKQTRRLQLENMKEILKGDIENPFKKSNKPTVNVPQGAIQALMSDPSLASQFDAKYGEGASQQYLK